MSRLTERSPDGIWKGKAHVGMKTKQKRCGIARAMVEICATCDDCKDDGGIASDKCPYGNILRKLAAYEDVGDD